MTIGPLGIGQESSPDGLPERFEDPRGYSRKSRPGRTVEARPAGFEPATFRSGGERSIP